MAKKNESILDILAFFPWWVSVGLSGISYLILKYFIPSIEFQQKGPADMTYMLFKALAGAAPLLAPMIALVLLFPALISFLNSFRKKKLLDKQQDLNSIRTLSWKQFEELVAEAYRRKGYLVVENEGAGPDGGVDLVLKKDGVHHLVQCKNWKSQKVGVSVVREMYGVMTAKHADSVIIITSGFFTQEAKNFATDKPIDLVEGNTLIELIRSVSANPEKEVEPDRNLEYQEYARKRYWSEHYKDKYNSQSYSLSDIKEESKKTANPCPNCGGELVLRVARQGKNAGSKFWGCSNFPKCNFTKAYMG